MSRVRGMGRVTPVDIGRYLLLSGVISLVYILLARLGLLMVLPPYQLAPLYPAAGWALAALLIWGLRYAPAVALASMLVQASMLPVPPGTQWLLALGIGCGAAAQAIVGTLLIRHWCGRPLLLISPRDIGRYLIAATLAGVISPGCAAAVLWTAGVVQTEQLSRVVTTWWTGDLMGVLIATPITLALVGRPRAAWAARRFSVGLPMLLTLMLVVLGIASTVEWDRQAARADFTRDASGAAQALAAELREPLLALEGVHAVLKVKPRPTSAEFARATSGLLSEDSPLLALGLSLRVPRAELAAFDAQAAADGLRDFRSRDRRRAGDLLPLPDEDMVVIRLVEPLSRNAAALGVNIMTIPGARAAAEQALRGERVVASAGIQLSQDAHSAVGVVLYQPLYRAAPAAGGRESRVADGIAFATLRPDLLLQRLSSRWPEQLAACIVDLAPDATQRRLAGKPGCEAIERTADHGLPLVKLPLQFGGRPWEVRVYDAEGQPLPAGGSWVFALVGLLATAMVGALLLLMSGRTLHVQAQVKARTEELEREIANRAEGEQALRQSEERFRSIFETAPIGIAFTDLDGGFQEVNAHFCDLVGYPAEQLAGRRSLEVTHPDDRGEDVQLARRLMRGEIPFYRRHKRYVRGDGRIAHARVLVSLLRAPNGRPHRLVGIVEDITDQLRMQELDRAREAAEAANLAKNEFLSRMSHELRTPLNAILGFSQLMQMDTNAPLPPGQQERAQQIGQAGWHLLEMINDTLDLSRIEAGSLRLEPVPLELAPVLARALALVQQPAAERGLSIRQQLDPPGLHVVADPTRLTQILTNLLSNAVKYNVDGGSVDLIASSPAPGWVELTVRDTGLGLDEAQRAALFQPFNRLGREHSGLPGTGIGLVISQRLAEMMGGSLRAETTDGAGACFVLRLPAADAVPPDTTVPRTPDATATAPAGPRRQVLYVEDNALNAEVMRGVLAQRPDIELQVAGSAAAARLALAERPPALLLLDWQLPDGDGHTVLAALRERGGALPPVVVVSADAQPEQIAQARAAGAAHYLTKPLDVRALLALLDELLAPAGATERAK